MVGLAENKATQASLAGAWAELGKMKASQTLIMTPKNEEELKNSLIYNIYNLLL